MKAISLWQPWASLIAAGIKPYETRHWPPSQSLIGQTIAIHAAKHVDISTAEMATGLMFGGSGLSDQLEASWGDCSDDLMGIFGQAKLPVGCIVCTARLDAAFLLGEPAEGVAVPAASVVRRFVSRQMPECFTVRYDNWGDYAPGRWAWLLREIKPIKPPVPVKGKQAFFDLPQGWLVP